MSATGLKLADRHRPIDRAVPARPANIIVTAQERRERRLAPETVRRAAAAFREQGHVVLEGAVDRERLADGAATASTLFADYCRRATLAPGGMGSGMAGGFDRFVQRAPGRFDLIWDATHAAFDHPDIGEGALWTDLVTTLLGQDHACLFRGLLMTLPHAGEQAWHTDGEHLFPGEGPVLPVHCLNVFIPLVDVHADNGPTEFCPGSQQLTGGLAHAYEQDANLPSRIGFHGDTVAPDLPLGSIVVFDYRVVHRGLGNRTGDARPVLYRTYAKPWFCDVRNFPARVLPG